MQPAATHFDTVHRAIIYQGTGKMEVSSAHIKSANGKQGRYDSP